MRRSEREVKDLEESLEIIGRCMVCRIAMYDNPVPYIVPLNFGYSYNDNQLILYFHCAKEGKKLELMRRNNYVSFEMDCNHQLTEAEKACQYGFTYASILGNGKVEVIESALEKGEALNFIMKHQSGKVFRFEEKELQSVCVFKVVADSFTGKKCK